MSFIAAKCSECGANISIDQGKKIGYCHHCGTKFITQDMIVQNITNQIYNESINGNNVNRQAVLDKLLLKYYNGENIQEQSLKDYAWKVLELDNTNVLANFVEFEDIKNSNNIKKILCDNDAKLSEDLFFTVFKFLTTTKFYDNSKTAEMPSIILNSNQSVENKVMLLLLVSQNLYDSTLDQVLHNIVENNLIINDISVIKKYIDNAHIIKNYNAFLTILHSLQLTESQNEEIFDYILTSNKFNKLSFLEEANNFSKSHNNFNYNSIKYEQIYLRLKSKKDDLLNKQNTQIEKEIESAKKKLDEQKLLLAKIKKQRKLKITFLIFLVIATTALIIFLICMASRARHVITLQG